jgi:hypothetical protein
MEHNAKDNYSKEMDTNASKWLTRLLVLAIFGYALVITHHGANQTSEINIEQISSHVGKDDRMSVSIEIKNNEDKRQKVKVAWYLSYPGDVTPWETGLFASSWQEHDIAASATSQFLSNTIVSIPTGTYQLSTFVHGFDQGNEVQIGEEQSTKFVHIINKANFYRVASAGPAIITSVKIPTSMPTGGQILHVAADVTVESRRSTKLPVRLSWVLVKGNSIESNSWLTTPILFLGPHYPISSPSTTVRISSEVLGAPEQNYALRLEVFIGMKLSDSIIVPTLRLSTGDLNRSIIRSFHPPVSVPIVIISTSFPKRLQPSSNVTALVTVANTEDTPSTGQLILQVGRVGDPEPWEDPAYTFPIVTFTMPPNSEETLQDSGQPSMTHGTYELGIYVHDMTPSGEFESGDQVFARSRMDFNGS